MSLPKTRSVLEEGIAQGLHSGAQLFVAYRGQIVANDGVGEARPSEPMTRDTVSLWMSAVKPVAAIAIGQLWERGLLGLDDRVSRHVPEFAVDGKEAVTIRQVLTHTGGFRGAAVSWTGKTYEENLSAVLAARQEPRWIPGRRAGYHVHTGWYVLGELVRRLDGRTYDQYVREEIFLPLGMDDSWVGMPRSAYESYGARIGPMYNTSSGAAEPADFGDSAEACAAVRPSGNGRGPVRELGRFYQMLLNGGVLPGAPNGGRILLPQTVEALVARHRVGMLDETFGHKMDWGLGFILDSKHYGQETLPYGYGPHASWRTFGHSGAESSCAFADPEHDLVAAWICNGMPGDAKHQVRQRAINAAIYEDLGSGQGASSEE